MNKRKAKKQANKAFLLMGMSYKEHRKENRAYTEYLTTYNHAHKIFKGFDEDERMMIEMGVYTEKEIMLMYGYRRTNTRWRTRRKIGANIVR